MKGANSHGQLGQGLDSPEEVPLPQEIENPIAYDIDLSQLTKIVGGAGHTLILDSSGHLFECGRHQQLNSPNLPASSRFRRFRSGLEGVRLVDIACGWDSSILLSETGQVFGLGSNTHGQLGSLRSVTKESAALIEGLPPICKLAMGLRHSAVITRDSKLFVSGDGTKGQLGVKIEAGVRSLHDFVLVPDLDDVSEVSCGQHHTVAITKNNRVFAWGDNKHGQLGIDPKLHPRVSTPVEVRINADALDSVHCGWTHTTILTSGGKLLTWGRNSYGQLGRVTSKADSWKPELLEISVPVEQLSVGSEHSVALCTNRSILSWGWNEHGNCGIGSKEDVLRPTNVALPENSGILIGTGAGHSFAVIKTN
ncbi:hypothetical protein QAD02_022322 [Eretmocerus hayati]|uniref:Uncharacterized protein n=1 Tax=Eretmocerus hayati TaxID=131215 RepID=A0ACC2PSS3_9HYME|nr:hypothetical protein QAD02_022322 [Eretmocerus hayati]